MNKKFFLFILAASAFLLAVLLLITKNQSVQAPPSPPTTDANLQSAMLVIDYGEGNSSSYNLGVDEKSTAFSLLSEFAEKENVSLETQQYDFGVFVKSVGGKESSAEAAWIYYVNGQSGQVAADLMKVNPGDTVEWKYVPPTEE